MSEVRIDPKKQFSKKLAGRAEWFWFFYMVLMAALIAYQPNAWGAAVILASLVTAVMITSVLAYTDNSKYEKGLYAPNQIAKNVRINFGEAFDKKEDSSDEEDSVSEGDGNG